jgi:UPF0755 protein
LYGDGGWGGQQAQTGQQPPYGDRPQHHPQQPQHGEWGHEQQAGHGGQQYQQYGEQGHQQFPQYDQQGHQQSPYHQQQGHHQYDQQRYEGHFQDQRQHHQGGWDGTGGRQQPAYPADPTDPYGQQAAGYGAGQPDFYGTPDAYPPPQPPGRRRAEPEPRPDWDPEPEPDQESEHAFFAGGGDEDDDADADADDPEKNEGRGRGDRKGRGGKGKDKGRKRRSGCACLVVVMVFGGGAVGVTYYGYQFYQNRFGAAPDYVGEGDGEQITVTIPKGAGGYTIGRVLKEAGVVKSVDAFVAAQEQNPNGKSIQAGTYTLNKHMSAAAAVQLMLSPKSKNNLIIAEGWRNTKIYAAIDQRLQLKPGTTQDVAKKEWSTLGLPDWANSSKEIKDPLEGFLYPSAYPVSKGMKPEDVLKQMVDTAKEKYAEFGIQAKAKSLDLQNPLQVLTVASLVQAEGKYKHDFEKVATVVYNRLKPNNTETYGLLDFDSTVNYLRGQSKLDTGSVNALRQIDDPYNTYRIKGLPPGPIDNPGEVAIKAALNPAKGNWYYFVSINENETLFAETNEEQNRNREKYLQEQKKGQ